MTKQTIRKISYERTKNSLKISGETKQVIPIILLDLTSRLLIKLLVVVIVIFNSPTAVWLSLIIKWLKSLA